MSAAAVLAERLGGVPVGRGRWSARCPAHQDGSPSLRIGEGREGRALLHCFAGCPPAAILASIGLTMAALWPAGPRPTPAETRAAREAKARQHAAQQASRRAERLRNDRLLRQWQEYDHMIGALAYRLALLPDGSPGETALTACWHALVAERRATEQLLTGEPEWD